MANSQVAGSQLVRGLHIIVDAPEYHYLLEELGSTRDDLVCYYAVRTGRLCIAKWVNKDRGLVKEITSWGRDQPFARWQTNFVRYYLSDRRLADIKRHADAVASEERARRRQLTDDSQESGRYRKHFVKRYVPELKKDLPGWAGVPFSPVGKLEA